MTRSTWSLDVLRPPIFLAMRYFLRVLLRWRMSRPRRLHIQSEFSKTGCEIKAIEIGASICADAPYIDALFVQKA